MYERQDAAMLPQRFLERMKQMLGDEYDDFLETFEQERYQALRLNALKRRLNGRSAAETLGAAVSRGGFLHLCAVPWAENGYYYISSDQPGKHPYHEAGVYYIQEPSAMAPVELLDIQSGDRVLDLCAAPGGKSTQIAAKLGGEGFLLCNEINAGRAKILAENVERMGVVNAYVTNETPVHLAEIFPEYFDKVLVDAPCSGEGMFRKNEAACEEWSPENVAMCAQRQDDILDCAAKMLRPGGRLVYSTCTFAPAENEGSVSRFLEKHTEFCLLPVEKERLGLTGCDGRTEYLEDDLSTDHLEYTLRLWPHKIRGEGHFAALFQKEGEFPGEYRNSSSNGFVTDVPDKELGEYFQFCQETFGKRELPVRRSRQAAYIKYGDNIYLVSPQMPSVKGLKVLRPGLHVGTLKKNRFEPSHALALALAPDEVRHVWNMDFENGVDPDKSIVTAYLNGQTFPAEGEKGWYLICVDDFSIGWGKLAGGMMKNHYPKGLRI